MPKKTIHIQGSAYDVGALTVAQLRAALTAYRQLAPLMGGKDFSRLEPSAISALAEAVIAITRAPDNVVYALPLDEFVNAVADVLVAAIDVNTEFLAGPVTDALDRLSATLTAAQPLQMPGTPPAAGPQA